jgi:hypothetical protein
MDTTSGFDIDAPDAALRIQSGPYIAPNTIEPKPRRRRSRAPAAGSPLYIAPDGKTGADAFAVIRDAMKDKDRVALARIVMANREHVIAIEPFGKGMLGTTLR